MTKDVMLTIKGVQKYPSEEPVETVTEVNAEYFLRGNSRYVLFEEKQEGFAESVKGMLKIKDNSVELTKKGLIQSHMVFEPDMLCMTEYRTPFGMMLLGVRTKSIRMLDAQNRINIDIQYLLESEEQILAESSIQITIREK